MKREAEAMIAEPTFDAWASARWRNRLEDYILKRCSDFYKPPKIVIQGLTSEDIRNHYLVKCNREKFDERAREELKSWTLLLVSLMEQAEAYFCDNASPS